MATSRPAPGLVARRRCGCLTVAGATDPFRNQAPRSTGVRPNKPPGCGEIQSIGTPRPAGLAVRRDHLPEAAKPGRWSADGCCRTELIYHCHCKPTQTSRLVHASLAQLSGHAQGPHAAVAAVTTRLAGRAIATWKRARAFIRPGAHAACWIYLAPGRRPGRSWTLGISALLPRAPPGRLRPHWRQSSSPRRDDRPAWISAWWTSFTRSVSPSSPATA